MELLRTDHELARAAPLVIDGCVLSRIERALRDDPFLPSDWEHDPESARMVNAGARHVVWEMRVDSWIKGASAPQIRAVRGMPGGTIGVGSSGLEEIGYDPQPGDYVRLWLEPDPWFEQDHWIVLRACAL